MSFVPTLYHRFAHLIHELTKFGIVGGIAFVVTYGGTNLLHVGMGVGPLTSNVIATVVGTAVAYLGNRFWTFRHRANSGMGREYFLFFVFNGIGLLIQLLCIGFTHYTLHHEDAVSYNISLFVGIALGTLFRYWSYKKWVFLPPQLPAIDPHTGLPTPEAPQAPQSLQRSFASHLRERTHR